MKIMTKDKTPQKSTEGKKHVAAIGKKLQDREALKIVFFAGKQLYGTQTATNALSINRRKN